MTKRPPDLTVCRYNRHRFPAEIIADAVWLSSLFPLSLRHVEDLLAERGIEAQRLDLQHRLCLLLLFVQGGFVPRRQRPGERSDARYLYPPALGITPQA